MQCAAAEWLAAICARARLRRPPPSDRRPPGGGRPTPNGKATAAPHVLFYGHYDVQPADPLDLWRRRRSSRARRRRRRAKRIVGRGAARRQGPVDDLRRGLPRLQGGTAACPATSASCSKARRRPARRRCRRSSQANAKELKADLRSSATPACGTATTPAITTMLRGLVVRGGRHHGGRPRPAFRPLRRRRDQPDPRAGARSSPTARRQRRGDAAGLLRRRRGTAGGDRRAMARLDFDAARVPGPRSASRCRRARKGRSVLEMIWSRPTCDVNGIVGGYTGEGAKTVLPAKASGEGLVPARRQPESRADRAAFRAFVRAAAAGRRARPSSSPRRLPRHAVAARDAQRGAARRAPALEAEWGKPPALIGSGGSIPIVGDFKRDLGMDSLMVGFGLDDDASIRRTRNTT